jgi:hypothetical protein
MVRAREFGQGAELSLSTVDFRERWRLGDTRTEWKENCAAGAHSRSELEFTLQHDLRR